jgi:mRNA interferase MazF
VALPGGLNVSGVVLADQVKSLVWRSRQADFICGVPDAVVKEVVDRIILLLTGG